MGLGKVEDFIKVKKNDCSDFRIERAINPWKYMIVPSDFSETVGYLKVSKWMCCLSMI